MRVNLEPEYGGTAGQEFTDSPGESGHGRCGGYHRQAHGRKRDRLKEVVVEPFTSLQAVAAPYYFPDVDTDKLIPHRFIRKPLAAGYGNFLLFDERHASDGTEIANFVLNQQAFRKAKIIVSGRNFGCGSTREGAVYALADFGFRAVIAPSFADIFKGNCLQNGLLPIVLDEDTVASLAGQLEVVPGAEISIDLVAQMVTDPGSRKHHFAIDANQKSQLLAGLDAIGITLEYSALIDQFEHRYQSRFYWLGKPA